MAKRRIRPKDRRNKGERIKPGSSRGVSPQTLPPKFSLRYLSQREHSLRNCQRDEKAAFADTLDKLSRLTWNRIASSNRHANGYEKIPRAQIKASIPQHITDEVNLLAFRFFLADAPWWAIETEPRSTSCGSTGISLCILTHEKRPPDGGRSRFSRKPRRGTRL